MNLEILSPAIRWCDENAGFISAVLTFTYVGATIWLVLLSTRQLNLALQIERDRLRPFVILDLIVELPLVFLSIRNFGPTIARDLQFQVIPPIQSVYGTNPTGSHERAEPIPVLEKGMPMLPPGKEIGGLVGQWTHVNSYNPSMRFTGKISYSSSDGRVVYEEAIIIDMSSELRLRKIQRNTVHELTKELQGLREEVRNVTTGNTQLRVRIDSEIDD